MLKTVVKYLLIPPALLLLHASAGKPKNPSVKVIPTSATVKIGHALQCTAKEKPFNAAVDWSVDKGYT